jgi:hypothetical protein
VVELTEIESKYRTLCEEQRGINQSQEEKESVQYSTTFLSLLSPCCPPGHTFLLLPLSCSLPQAPLHQFP